MEAEVKSAKEYSKEELRRQLYASLRSTGVLDSMKGQLRARLLAQHLRHPKDDLMQPKKRQRKPSLIERLLSSLFLDYLEANAFTFTVSVFMPESQMSSWPPFSYQEMLELLHFDPSSDLHTQLDGEGRECLAHQLVTVLQQMANRSSIQEVSTQTNSPAGACKRAMRTSCTSPQELERSIKEVEDAYIKKKEAHEAQRALPHHSLEDKLIVLHQEFDARVNAEVALQIFINQEQCVKVCRIRDYEINAARMDEAARYRRQLARDREELEDIHKSRMNRVKAREESLLERMLSKEKAIEASAYEQRQKILIEITSLRERENKLRQFKELQERQEEKLNERVLSLKAKEEEVVLERKALYAQADEIGASRRKELEEQYKELCDRLRHDQALLGAEREQLKEEKVAMAIELAASRSDKELIQALHRRLSVEEDQRLKLDVSIRELEEKLKQQTSPVPAPVADQRHRNLTSLMGASFSLEEQLRELQVALEQERLRRQASEKANKTLERKLQQKKVELATARSPQGEWITEHKNLMATIYKQETELRKQETKVQLMETEIEKLTNRHKKLLLKIDHLDTLGKKAREEKDHLVYNLEILQAQQTTNERELLETTTLLRKAQQALEAERLEHCALRSHMNAVVPSTRNNLNNVTLEEDHASQNKPERNSGLFHNKPSVDVSSEKKRGSLQKKQKPDPRELWTRLLSDNAAKRASLDQDLGCNHLLTSPISKPFSSGNGEDQSSNLTDLNGLTPTTIEKLRTGKEGITMVTRTLIDGSIEAFTSSLDRERCGDHSYKDAISSWRKAHLTEVATPTSWNNDYNDSTTSVQGLVTDLQWNRTETSTADCCSWKDPMVSCNTICFGEMTEECGKQLLQGAEMTTEFGSTSTLETNGPSANLQNLQNSDTPVDQIAFSNLGLEKEENFTNRDDDNNLSSHGAQEENEHVQGAESIWSQLYLQEQEKNSRLNSDAEEGSSKCMISLKHDLESLASIHSKDEIHMGSSCGPQMDSHSEGDHTPVAFAAKVHQKPTVMPEMKYSRLLNVSPESHVASRACQYMEPDEEIKDNQHHTRSEECQTREESKPVQGNRSTAAVIGNEAREMDAGENESLSYAPVPLCLSDQTHKLMKLTDEVNDVTSPAPTMTESEEIVSTQDNDIARYSGKDLGHLMRKLGLTGTILKDQEIGSCKEEKILSLLSQVGSKQDESRRLLRGKDASASGRMSGLPEMGEMLFRQGKAQKDLQGYLMQDCTTEGQTPTERVEMKDDRVTNLDYQEPSTLPDYDKHALESLRSSTVIRKEEVAEEESPRSHPTLKLAIRNNEFAKLGKEDEFQKGERSTSALGSSQLEAIMDTKSTRNESSHMRQASESVHALVSHRGADSSGEESAYKSDSFEEDEEEDEIDEKPAYSEESCTNVGSMPTTKITASNGLEMSEKFSPESKTKVGDDRSKSLDESSENWEGESEQGSYSPEGDDKVADSVE